MGAKIIVVELSRTQTKLLADALAPFMAKYSSRAAAAADMGFKEYVLQAVCERRAATRIPKDSFEKLVAMTKIDVSKWDLSRY